MIKKGFILSSLLIVILTSFYVPLSSAEGDSNEEELIKLRIRELELKKEVLELESKNNQAIPLSSSTSDTTTQERSRSTNSGFIRGPRGGCYTIGSTGRKRYVDRSMCN